MGILEAPGTCWEDIIDVCCGIELILVKGVLLPICSHQDDAV